MGHPARGLIQCPIMIIFDWFESAEGNRFFEAADEPVGGRTVGQMTVAEKHMRSHRGKAARSMSEYLRTAGW